VLAKRHVKFPTLVKATKSVKTGSVQIIEELRSFSGFCLAFSDKFIETVAVFIEKLLLIFHFHAYRCRTLELPVKVYEMWIDIIQEGSLWFQPERNRKSTAKWINITPL
jgi:hypothetical protein